MAQDAPAGKVIIMQSAKGRQVATPADGRDSKVVDIPVKDLFRDEAVNPRDPSDAWIRARSGEHYSRDLLRILTVSYRDGSDGRKPGPCVLDGWNRRQLVMANEGFDAEVRCEVYSGLSREKEARMFLGGNDARKVGAIPRHLAEVTAGIHPAMQVQEIITAAGCRVASERGPGVVACIQEVRRIHDKDRLKCGTARKPLALKRTLEVITQAWRATEPAWYAKNTDALHMAVIGGVGMLFAAWGDAADVTRMARILAEWDGGADSLMRQAHGIQGVIAGMKAGNKAVAHLVGLEYNKALRNKLQIPTKLG
jgi:hypothetical protein